MNTGNEILNVLHKQETKARPYVIKLLSEMVDALLSRALWTSWSTMRRGHQLYVSPTGSTSSQ